MNEYKVGDLVFDRFRGAVIKYHSGYEYMSIAQKDVVLRHATPKEIEEIKAVRRL